MDQFTRALFFVLFAMLLPGVSGAMSSTQLRSLLANDTGQRIVVIDVRTRAEFDRGHIPGALRISTFGLDRRRVPPFGRVVLVWDGIDKDRAREVLDLFNAKPGIDAELLDGGFPAWANSGGYSAAAHPDKDTARQSTRSRAAIPGVSWKQLMKLAEDPDLVVVDLRHTPRRVAAKRTSEAVEFTDLAALLPKARVIAPAVKQRSEMKRGQQSAQGLDRQGIRQRKVPAWLRGQRFDADSIYVLVDAGDGRLSERVARRLAARGLKRVYMLIGGERALVAEGEATQVTRETVRPIGIGQ